MILVVALAVAFLVYAIPGFNVRPQRARSALVGLVTGLLVAAAALVLQGCQRGAPAPPPDVPVVDAAMDASMLGDALPPSGCALLCANLDILACHPLATCADACARGVLLKVIDPGQVTCVIRAQSADDVRGCGGGFCR